MLIEGVDDDVLALTTLIGVAGLVVFIILRSLPPRAVPAQGGMPAQTTQQNPLHRTQPQGTPRPMEVRLVGGWSYNGEYFPGDTVADLKRSVRESE